MPRSLHEIIPLLACAACGNPGLVQKGSRISCISCEVSWPCIDERIYFSTPPENVPESIQQPVYRTWSAWRKANYHFFKAALPKDPSLHVLDIGAGPTQFRDLFTQYAMVVGLDFYPYEEVQIVADITKQLPMEDAAFDIVILSNVLEHTPDVLALLHEVRRVLAPGGICLATTPFLMRVHQAPYDYSRLTSYQLERMFSETDFVSITVSPLGRPVDVFRTMQKHALDSLIVSLHKRNDASRLPLLFLTYFVRMFLLLQLQLLTPLFRLAEPSERYTEGFGTKAKVPQNIPRNLRESGVV